jgi:hypothetical protein
MKLRGTTALIVGNAVLFGAIACESDETGGGAGGGGGTVGGSPGGNVPGLDASTGGSPVGGTPVGGTPVGGSPVGGTPVGGTPVGGTPVGGTPVGGTPVGGTPVGGTPVGGTPVGGELPILDAGVVDAAPADAAPVDAAPADVGGPAVCADLLGLPCEMQSDGCCDSADTAQAMCDFDQNQNLTWMPIPPDWFCGCDSSSGRTQVFCAVPGFVGITHAGRRALSGRRLRRAA